MAETTPLDENIPSTFVVTKGKIGKYTKELMLNFRKVMDPYTAKRLKTTKSDKIKHLILAGSTFGVTHIVMFFRGTDKATMRIIRTPSGPTLEFSIETFTLMKEISKFGSEPKLCDKFFQYPALLILNGLLPNDPQDKFIISAFQSMYPSINVKKTKISKIRRCVILNKNSNNEIEFRHFGIQVHASGISQGVKNFFKYKVPNMAALKDISDYVVDDKQILENEANENEITIPSVFRTSKASVKLFEIGPRMVLKLHKIQQGVCSKEVLFHAFVNKTEAEKEELRKKHKTKLELKAERIKKQEENVARKAERLSLKKKKRIYIKPGSSSESVEKSAIASEKKLNKKVGKAKIIRENIKSRMSNKKTKGKLTNQIDS